jgi:hypothetical protein
MVVFSILIVQVFDARRHLADEFAATADQVPRIAFSSSMFLQGPSRALAATVLG